MYLFLFLTVLAVQRVSATYDANVTVLVLNSRTPCQLAKARAFDTLGCAVLLTTPFANVVDRRAIQGTSIALLQYGGTRIDTIEFSTRFAATNRPSPRIICLAGKPCQPYRPATVYAQAASEVEQQMEQVEACATMSTTDRRQNKL